MATITVKSEVGTCTRSREFPRTGPRRCAQLERGGHQLTCGFVPSERRSCSHLLGRFRLSLEVKSEVTRAATVGFPAQQAEEHLFHGPTVRPEKVTLPAARAFTSFASHSEIITTQPGSKEIRFFLYGPIVYFHGLDPDVVALYVQDSGIAEKLSVTGRREAQMNRKSHSHCAR